MIFGILNHLLLNNNIVLIENGLILFANFSKDQMALISKIEINVKFNEIPKLNLRRIMIKKY